MASKLEVVTMRRLPEQTKFRDRVSQNGNVLFTSPPTTMTDYLGPLTPSEETRVGTFRRFIELLLIRII